MAFYQVRKLWLWLIAAIAILSQVALFAVIARLCSTALGDGIIYSIALAAAVLDGLGLAFLLAAIALILRNTESANERLNRPQYYYAGILGIIGTLVASILSMYVLAWTYANGQSQQNGSTSPGLALAGFAVWALAFTSQLGLLVLICFQWPQDHEEIQEETLQRPSPAKSSKRSFSVQMTSMAAPPFFPASPPPLSPTYSNTSSPSSRSSLQQHSFHQVVRPVTSKTRLILSNPFMGKDTPTTASREPSVDNPRHDDGFATWDTSTVPDFEPRPVQRGRLETIPGSRPVSPAKPLDGPFSPPHTVEEEANLPDPPQSPSSLSRTPSFRPRNDSISSTRRPSTVNNDQSHIHPLFRTESPNPSPLASPGTIITASPLAGQVLSGEAWGQHRRAESPGPMSPPRSRAASLKSQRSRLALDEIEEVPPLPVQKHVAG